MTTVCPDCEAIIRGKQCLKCGYILGERPIQREWTPEPHPADPTPEQVARVKALLAELQVTLSMPSQRGGTEGLAPCPHCGHFPMPRMSRVDGQHYLRCPGCGATTAAGSRADAVKAWAAGEIGAPLPWWQGDNLKDAGLQEHARRLMAKGIEEGQARRLARDLVAQPGHRETCAVCQRSGEVPF